MTLSAEQLQRATQAKSDQLNSCDLLGGPLVAQILDVQAGSSDQPVVIKLDSWPQPWKPSKTALRVLCACWGGDPSVWVGRYVVLYNDETVKWAGEAVGGIRTSHLSHIDSRKTIMVNATRGKKAAQVVDPYYPDESAKPAAEVPYYPDDKFAENLPKWVTLLDGGSKTAEQIIKNVEKGGYRLTAGQKSRIKPSETAEQPPAHVADQTPPPFDGDPFAEE